MIDTHAHLFDTAFEADLADVISRAQAVGVSDFILPAIDSQSHAALLSVAERYPCCHATIGLHPTSVNDNPQWESELQMVLTRLQSPSVGPVVAIGEIGLDLYWSRDFIDQQIIALKTQLEMAIEYDLPVILHVRDGWDEIFAAMEPYRGSLRGVFHSFSGSADHYAKTQLLGDFRVGIGGVVTFKSSTLPEIIANIPLEKILLETDAPYLTPVPHRGKRNQSAYIPLIAAKIAQIKGCSLEEVDVVTSQNARELFKI